MINTLSEEMDDWLRLQELRSIPPARMIPPAAVLDERDCTVIPPCPFSDREIDWIWPKYQACSFPPATFAKRFARTPRERLTLRGKNAAASLGYRYRRQIFGKRAVKWSEADFLTAVREAAAK